MSDTSDDALTLSHNYTEGTLLDGTSRGDGTNEILRSIRSTWKWSRALGMWCLTGTRNLPARRHVIAATQQALEQAGHRVEVTIDDTAPTMAEREAFRANQADQRAEALAAKAQRRIAEGEARYERGNAVFERIPLGQPMLIGHHSYNADRRRRERATNNLFEGFAKIKEGNTIAQRAETAGKYMRFRHNPITVANRIDKLEAELRTAIRRGDVEAEKQRLTDELTYWKNYRQQQIDDGIATNYSKDTVAVGGHVFVSGTRYKILRANPTTVTVKSMFEHRVKYHEIQNYRSPEEIQEIKKRLEVKENTP